MKVYMCDKCGIRLDRGPLRAYSNVVIEIQPSYSPVEFSVKWHLCLNHSMELERFLKGFRSAESFNANPSVRMRSATEESDNASQD